MNSRFAVAVLLGAATLFVVGFLLWGMLFMQYFTANALNDVMKELPDPYWALIVGQLAYATLLTLVIGSWARTTGAVPGLKTAAIVGLLFGMSVDFTMLATAEIHPLASSLIDVLLVTVQSAIGGAVIGWWLGRGEGETAG